MAFGSCSCPVCSFPAGSSPVSYTHLDVYKRQGRLYGEFIRLDGLLHLSKTPLHIPVDGIGRPLDVADEPFLLLDLHPGTGLAHLIKVESGGVQPQFL